MKVTLLSDIHATATEKKAIRDCVKAVIENPALAAEAWLKAPRCKKSYAINPVGDDVYEVGIKENYTTDFGKKRQHLSKITVRVA